MVAGQVGDIEHIDRLLAEGGDLRRGDVEIEAEQRFGDVIEQADTVEAVDFDDGEAVRRLIVHHDPRLDAKGAEARLGAALRHHGLEMKLAFSALRISSHTRPARRCSSASSGNSRLISSVSSAMPSTVV